jgi:hypothetical protein
MTTTITATYTADNGEQTIRKLTLPHDVTDRVGELIGLGLIAELPIEWDSDDVDVEVQVSAGSVKRVGTVEHPPGPGEDFPSWTITADAPSEPIVSDATANSDMKRIRVEFVCVPDDGESIVLEVDGLRTRPPIDEKGVTGWWMSLSEVERVSTVQATSEKTTQPSAARTSADGYTCVIKARDLIVGDHVFQSQRHPDHRIAVALSDFFAGDLLPGKPARVAVPLRVLAVDLTPRINGFGIASIEGLNGHGLSGDVVLRPDDDVVIKRRSDTQASETTQQSGEPETHYEVGDLIEVVARTDEHDPPIGHQTAVYAIGHGCVYIQWARRDYWQMNLDEIKLVKRAAQTQSWF